MQDYRQDSCGLPAVSGAARLRDSARRCLSTVARAAALLPTVLGPSPSRPKAGRGAAHHHLLLLLLLLLMRLLLLMLLLLVLRLVLLLLRLLLL